MNAGMKITLISCIAAGVLTVSVPLLSEATNRGRGHAVIPPEVILLPQENAVTDGTDEMPAGTPTEQESPVTEPLPEEDITVRVLDADTGKITEMALDGYITCVVAAEMPYTFNSEALKAQAVAARSFCLYRMKNGTGHDGYLHGLCPLRGVHNRGGTDREIRQNRRWENRKEDRRGGKSHLRKDNHLRRTAGAGSVPFPVIRLYRIV